MTAVVVAVPMVFVLGLMAVMFAAFIQVVGIDHMEQHPPHESFHPREALVRKGDRVPCPESSDRGQNKHSN
jgi:hypothetical protein